MSDQKNATNDQPIDFSSEALDEILYNLIMLNKVREANEVDSDEDFLKAKQALTQLHIAAVQAARIDETKMWSKVAGKSETIHQDTFKLRLDELQATSSGERG